MAFQYLKENNRSGEYMKVVGVYDKYSGLKCFNKNAFMVMRNFFAKLPKEYGKCYFDNLETLKLLKVDEFKDDRFSGMYNSLGNVVMFSKNNALGHELFHVASYDRSNDARAFEGYIDIEQALIEGMTEYLFMTAYGLSGTYTYPFEVFCIKMLDDIPGLFEPYFIPNHENFINLFPNKRIIYSLMYALNSYHEDIFDCTPTFNNESSDHVQPKTKEAIKGVIDSLISIELSRKINNDDLEKYADKFMDEISSGAVKETLTYTWPKYHNYANKQVNTRIRRKGE